MTHSGGKPHTNVGDGGQRYECAVPPGHFWRGVPEANRHQCRNCGHHYDEHHHTDEASRCPTQNRIAELEKALREAME